MAKHKNGTAPASKKSVTAPSQPKRTRVPRPIPNGSFSDALPLGEAIMQHASGAKVRRLTLLEKMQRSPTAGSTQTLITNSGKYGITKGSYAADWLELTPEGTIACDERASPRDRLKNKFELAIAKITPFKALYDEYVGKRIPAPEVMRDFLQDSGVEAAQLDECTDIFTVNTKDLGLLRTIGGNETLVSIEQALEQEPTSKLAGAAVPDRQTSSPGSNDGPTTPVPHLTPTATDWSKTCFYITPIGEEGSEPRKHADFFMSALVEPAIKELGLKVVRADQIEQPGMINSQVFEHIKRCRLAVADLSTLNPNVFYETALRHACRLPVVVLIRKSDRIPFDVNQMRCIQIDTTDWYSLFPKLQTHKSELATQARKALEDPLHVGNPITVFFPQFWDDAGAV